MPLQLAGAPHAAPYATVHSTMRESLRSASAKLQRLWRLLIIFLILRLVAGIVVVAFNDGFAWGIELTLITAATVVIPVLVALAVRRWAPPHRTS